MVNIEYTETIDLFNWEDLTPEEQTMHKQSELLSFFRFNGTLYCVQRDFDFDIDIDQPEWYWNAIYTYASTDFEDMYIEVFPNEYCVEIGLVGWNKLEKDKV